MKIHQLGVTFDPVQDRLLLRINTSDRQELEVWLTRRITTRWVQALSKLIVDQLASNVHFQTTLLNAQDKQMYADFKIQEQWGKSDFKTPYQRGTHRLLPEGPLLLTDLQMMDSPEGLTLIRLQEREHEYGVARSMEIQLNPELLTGLLHLLQELWPTTGWSEMPSSESLQTTDLAITPASPGRLLN